MIFVRIARRDCSKSGLIFLTDSIRQSNPFWKIGQTDGRWHILFVGHVNEYPYKRKNGCVLERKELFSKEKIVDFVKSDPARAKCISVALLSACVQRGQAALCERDFSHFFNKSGV